MIALLSDGHITSSNVPSRTDSALKTSIGKFRFVAKYSSREGAPLLQGGDFLNTPRDFLALFFLIKVFKQYKPEMYMIRGQHDYYYRTNKPSVAGTLVKLGFVKLLGEDPTHIKGYNVYGSSYGEKVPRPKGSRDNILVVHTNVSDRPLYPGHEFTSVERFIEDNPGYDFILFADIHRTFVCEHRGTYGVNTGPMFRRSIDEANEKPCLFVIKNGGINKVSIPHEDPWRLEEAEQDSLLYKKIDEFANAIRTDHIKEVNALNILEEMMVKNKKHIDQETLQAIKEIKDEARS
jgi:hypothetical protein